MRLRRLLSILQLQLRSVFRRACVEKELDEEIRDHIDRRVAADERAKALRHAHDRFDGALATIIRSARELLSGRPALRVRIPSPAGRCSAMRRAGSARWRWRRS